MGDAMTADLPTCDDCRQTYDAPPYYTFERPACVADLTTMLGEMGGLAPVEAVVRHAGLCTGNLCPGCAGPLVGPDDPADPRRTIAESAPRIAREARS